MLKVRCIKIVIKSCNCRTQSFRFQKKHVDCFLVMQLNLMISKTPISCNCPPHVEHVCSFIFAPICFARSLQQGGALDFNLGTLFSPNFFKNKTSIFFNFSTIWLFRQKNQMQNAPQNNPKTKIWLFLSTFCSQNQQKNNQKKCTLRNIK